MVTQNTYNIIYSIIEEYLEKEHKEELKKFYQHIKNFFNSKQLNQITFNYFKECLIEIIINGYDAKKCFFELLNGDDEYTNHYYNELCYIKDAIKDYDYNLLSSIINNYNNNMPLIDMDYYDTDYIIEDIMYLFNWNKKDYDIYTSYNHSYLGYLYLKLNNDLDDLNSWDKKYINKDDIKEHLDDNLDIQEIFNIFVVEHVYKGYKIDYKIITKTEKEVYKLSKIELKNILKTKKEYLKNLINSKKEVYKCNNKKLVNEIINKEINLFKNQIEDIKEVLK